MKKIFIFMVCIFSGLLFASAADVTNMVAVLGGNEQRAQNVLEKITQYTGVFFPALYLIAAVDPTNRVVRVLDKLNKILAFFSPLEKTRKKF